MAPATLTLTIPPEVDLGDPAVRAVRDRLARWQRLFSPGEERFALDGYEDLYSRRGDELLVYDNYAEADTRWTGFERYRATWDREINANFPGHVMYRVEVDRIEASGDLAWSAATWWGKVEKGGGTLWPAQHATHVWRRIDGEWRIVHEHLTSGVKEAGAEARREPAPARGEAPEALRHARPAGATARGMPRPFAPAIVADPPPAGTA